MSDLLDQIRKETAPKLTSLAQELGGDFLGGLSSILEGADANSRAKVEALIMKGFEFKEKALTAKTQDEARMYAGEVETATRRVKTVLLAEKLVGEESTATLISNLFSKALDGLGKMAMGLLGTVAEGIAKGAIASLTGGEGGGSFDPSSIFPFG